MKRARNNSAFTLFELILVLVIMATVMALAAPQLRNWGKGSKVRDCADDFVSTTKWARVQASAKGVVSRLNIKSDAFSVSLQEGQNFVDDVHHLSKPVQVPDGAQITASSQNQPVEAIYFYPTGRVEPAPISVKITGSDGAYLEVVCETSADDFVVLSGEERR